MFSKIYLSLVLFITALNPSLAISQPSSSDIEIEVELDPADRPWVYISSVMVSPDPEIGFRQAAPLRDSESVARFRIPRAQCSRHSVEYRTRLVGSPFNVEGSSSLNNANLCNARKIILRGHALHVIQRDSAESARLALDLGNEALELLRNRLGMRIENDGRVIINPLPRTRVSTLPSGEIEIAPATAASGQ